MPLDNPNRNGDDISLKLKPDSSCFNQADENSNEEEQVLGGGVSGRGRQRDAALAEIAGGSAFLAHHLRGDRAMKNRNQHAQQQPCNFNHHRSNSKHCTRTLQSVEKPI